MAKAKNTAAPVETININESLNARLSAIVGVELSDATVAEVKALFAKAPSKRQFKHWRVVSTTFGAKTPLQMQQAVLAADGMDKVDMKTWAERLAVFDGFKTNQPVERIIAFYKARMISEGLVEVVAE
jgi:hypothetical protein